MTFTSYSTDRRSVRLVLAFGAIYLVWGSSYLAIRIGLESVAPLTLAALRSLAGGAILLVWARTLGQPWPTTREWRRAMVIGGLLFLAGHGGLFWVLGRIPSGVAAVLFATIPVWMSLAQGVGQGFAAVRPRVVIALLGGLAGVSLLVGPGVLGGGRVEAIGVVVAILAAGAWAAGSAYARAWTLDSVTMATATYLLAGGGLLLVAALVSGGPAFAPAQVTLRSVMALAYLVVCGSVVSFAAYTWLLGQVSLVAVSTYAYVNPVVALLLGWLAGGETLEPRVLAAAILVLSSVALMLSAPSFESSRRQA